MRLKPVDSPLQTRSSLIDNNHMIKVIENWSVWFDIYIPLRTVPAVLFTREVY